MFWRSNMKYKFQKTFHIHICENEWIVDIATQHFAWTELRSWNAAASRSWNCYTCSRSWSCYTCSRWSLPL